MGFTVLEELVIMAELFQTDGEDAPSQQLWGDDRATGTAAGGSSREDGEDRRR